jgi:hypothetical protein
LKIDITFASLYGNGRVVQLVRIRACHARGRGFESRPDRQQKPLEIQEVFLWIAIKVLLAQSFGVTFPELVMALGATQLLTDTSKPNIQT